MLGKITKGKWEFKENETFVEYARIKGYDLPYYEAYNRDNDGNWLVHGIAKVLYKGKGNKGYNKPDPEGFANAELIAEAGTVANETGLTPRQLLEQRNELFKRFYKVCRENDDIFIEKTGALGCTAYCSTDDCPIMKKIAKPKLKNAQKLKEREKPNANNRSDFNSHVGVSYDGGFNIYENYKKTLDKEN